jgi:hypothetical protein
MIVISPSLVSYGRSDFWNFPKKHLVNVRVELIETLACL